VEGSPAGPTRPLADALRAQKARSRAKSAEAFAAAERLVDRLGREGISKRTPGVGDRAPDFELPNGHGTPIRLGDLLGRSAVVLAFYRGGW
jgi:hypothetical protein